VLLHPHLPRRLQPLIVLIRWVPVLALRAHLEHLHRTGKNGVRSASHESPSTIVVGSESHAARRSRVMCNSRPRRSHPAFIQEIALTRATPRPRQKLRHGVGRGCTCALRLFTSRDTRTHHDTSQTTYNVTVILNQVGLTSTVQRTAWAPDTCSRALAITQPSTNVCTACSHRRCHHRPVDYGSPPEVLLHSKRLR
jgi:hypothetical protein